MKFKIMGKKGDNVAVYDDVEIQQAKFDELEKANYWPMVAKGNGGHTVLKAFDPAVEEILWVPKVAGG